MHRGRRDDDGSSARFNVGTGQLTLHVMDIDIVIGAFRSEFLNVRWHNTGTAIWFKLVAEAKIKV